MKKFVILAAIAVSASLLLPSCVVVQQPVRRAYYPGHIRTYVQYAPQQLQYGAYVVTQNDCSEDDFFKP